jgi:hypothetical protein
LRGQTNRHGSGVAGPDQDAGQTAR